jgi:hypothetical protein
VAATRIELSAADLASLEALARAGRRGRSLHGGRMALVNR